MKGHLLDVNVLLALAWPNHVQHTRAHGWFTREHPWGWGTCTLKKTVPRTLAPGRVSNGYLATGASLHGLKLATFDRQLARTFSGNAILVE